MDPETGRLLWCNQQELAELKAKEMSEAKSNASPQSTDPANPMRVSFRQCPCLSCSPQPGSAPSEMADPSTSDVGLSMTERDVPSTSGAVPMQSDVDTEASVDTGAGVSAAIQVDAPRIATQRIQAVQRVGATAFERIFGGLGQ